MEDEAQPFTLARAWENLAYAVDLILAVCGLPQAIAAQRLLRKATREQMLAWIAPIEAMARRILLLAALKEPTPNLPPPAMRGKPIASTLNDAPRHEPSEDPADWRVMFSVWPRGAGARKPRATDALRADVRAGLSLNAYPLARRVEALLRLAHDPSSAIARMARKIAARRAQIPIAFARYRHNATCVQSMLDEVQAEIDAALCNTS